MINRAEARDQLQAVGHYMMENQLAWGNAGNISARVAADQYLITASGTYLGELGEGDFTHCNFNGNISFVDRKPSKEMPMHKAIYEERPEINAILHASPFYSTLVACSEIEIPANLFVESMYYLERIERVPYHHPGSVELGEAVREKASKANILLLENHGVLVYDTSVQEARMSLQTLEMVCRMIVTVEKSDIKLSALSNETVDDFLHHSGYKPKRKW
ncbi:class II aldolase/adducin family protein [Bacillus sp. FSL K6-3431]|uniref:class II aldolase/adducin family protein n=1 Tax=Bacillus sp. FSL K6-3431 TaxID=2921500 RepID=UPI0030FD20C6